VIGVNKGPLQGWGSRRLPERLGGVGGDAGGGDDGRIRRAYFIEGKTIRAICRDLQASRKVVRKVLRSGATEFRYERSEQPTPRIGPWKDRLDRSAKPSRERLTLIRLFEQLRGLGYEGGYDALRRYARIWGRDRTTALSGAFVPLSFAPGEAYQFDWSHEVVVISGATVTVKVAQVRLCHSRMLFVRAYPRETQEMVFDAHDRAFSFFKGACTRGIYDNMKTAVQTARRHPDGRRDRLRTRLVWCASGSSHRE
jgi:transposase